MAEPFAIGGGVNGYNPSTVGGTGTSTKIFPNLLANATGLPASFTGSPVPTLPPAGAQIVIPGTGQYEQQQIVVTAGGYVYVHGTSPTLNFLLQSGTSLTSGSNTTIATLASAQSLTTASYYPWSLSVKLQGDAKSGVVQVFSGTFVCNGVSGSLTLTNLTGQNLTTTNINLVIGVTFGVSDALNFGALSQFWATVS